VYILDWDFAVVFALEREPLPRLKQGRLTHRRVHFRLDGTHPVGASHHQKVVVVDDAIAFVGGIDLAIRRWDTPAHRALDPQRVDPHGQPYPPVHDVQADVPTWQDRLLPDGKILDPERPLVPERLIEPYIPADHRESGGRRLMRSAILLLMLVGLAAAWRWTPLGRWLDVATLVQWIAPLRHHLLTPLMVIGAYLLGGLVGRDTVQRLAGARLSHLSQRIARHGLIAILLVRIVPVAPFTVVNVMAGASHVRACDFALGTFLGMLPGLLLMTLFGDRLHEAMRSPKMESFLSLAALVVVIVLMTVWLRRRFTKSPLGAASDSPPHERDRARLQDSQSKTRARRGFGGFL
jgi:hypothetical protein